MAQPSAGAVDVMGKPVRGPLPRDIAFQKLEALSQGAAIVRGELQRG